MDIMTGLLAPVLAVTLVSGQLDLQFDNSTACIGETLYAGCANLHSDTLLFWNANDSFTLEFGVTSEVGENRALMSDGSIIAIATLTALVHDDVLPNERVFFNTTLAITNSVNNTQFYCGALGVDRGREWISPSFNIVRFGTPSAPENLAFNGTVLSWDRPAYIGGTDLSHYQVSYSGINRNVGDESLDRNQTIPLHGSVSVYTINECGQSSTPSSLSLPAASLPLLSNPKTQWYCHQPLNQGRQVIIRWDVDTTGVSLPTTWQASNGLTCDTDDSICTGRLSNATQIKLRVDNRVIADTYSIDMVPNALFLDSGNNSVILRLNPDCKPMVYKVDINPCGVMAKPGDDNLELSPGQSQELPVTTSCIEASLLSDGHVIESANITLQLSGASAPALALPLMVMLGYVVLPQLAEVIQGR